MGSVGNVSLELYFHSEKPPCEFPDVLAVPLLAVGAGGVQVNGSCSPVVWGPALLPWLLSPSPLGRDRRDAAARGCTKAHPCEHPARASLVTLGCGMGGTTEISLMSWAVRSGQVARDKYPQILENCPGFLGTVEINPSICAQLGLNLEKS